MANASTVITDGYDAWYAEKLWRLLPAIYRTQDTSSVPGGLGPLREMVNRLGMQIAVVRRSIDRLWEDQSIETCDDWVIPYIGDLLATRIIAFADTRAQRLDVAKTIFYRRREGTLGLLEQLAADVAGRDAHVVEFFRRLGRTRHQFDPPIGLTPTPADPTVLNALPISMLEGLVGVHSMTPAGGFADLRNVYGASNASTAFDEFAHNADLRRGGQSTGWQNISHLGVFIWWLQSFPIVSATPCAALAPCIGHFSFDPTGRQTKLFAQSMRTTPQSFGDNWVAPREWELPVAIRQTLFNAVPDELYPNSLSVSLAGGGAITQMPRSQVTIFTDLGLFSFVGAPPSGPVVASYSFGFLSMIGAGGFNASALFPTPAAVPAALPQVLSVSGGTGPALASGTVTLASALATAAGATGATTIEIVDSLTYAGPTTTMTVPAAVALVVKADSPQRPVLRWPNVSLAAPSTWTIHGGGAGASLTLQGMWLQGADIVLTGSFDTVDLRLLTLDPGTSATVSVTPPGQVPSAFYGTAIDGVPLRPTTLFIEATVGQLIVERCITGPIRTRNGGAVEVLTATDSILQSIATHSLGAGPLFDPENLATHLKNAASTDTLAQQLIAALSSPTGHADLNAYVAGTPPSAQLVADLVAAVALLPSAVRAAVDRVYPLAFADVALGTSSGDVSLSRCTVLGPTFVDRMDASETIFDDVVTVEDSQHGCVRFSAYAVGSNLHQPYRSDAIQRVGPIFVTRAFGDPDYARLRRDADAAILGPSPGDGILAGAENGSEIGAFSLERIALKKRGLTLKFIEFMPLGVAPVWIDAD